MRSIYLDRISPFEAKVSEDAIYRFVTQLEENNVNLHGFLMLRGGRIFAEGYYKPFTKAIPHRMYSISKSITSLAVGLLQAEGKLSIDDYICNYFPDKLPQNIHPFTKEMKIKHLLTMTTAHLNTTYAKYKNDDWIESFFHVKPTHHSGTFFSYDTSASHTLSALVQKLSGKTLFHYFNDKVLKKLNFSKQTKWLTDSKGICNGSSGLICTMEDLAKLSYTIMDGGRFLGEELLPYDYIKEATTKQVDTSMLPFVHEQQGYGYQFFLTKHNGYAMHGLGGQLSISLPDEEFILITTADTQGDLAGVANIYQALWQQIYPELVKENVICLKNNIKLNDGIKMDFNTKKNENKEELLTLLSKLSIKPLVGYQDFSEINHANGKVCEMCENIMGLKWMKMTWRGHVGILEYENATGNHQLIFGLGNFEYQKFPNTEYRCMTSGALIGDHIIRIKSNIIDEELGSVDMQFGFLEHSVSVKMKKASRHILHEYDGVAVGKIIK